MDAIEELLALVRPRLEERARRVAILDRRDQAYSFFRLLVFAVAAVVGWNVLFGRDLSAGWLVLPLAGFLTLAIAHEWVVTSRTRAQRALSYHERILRRLNGESVDREADTARTPSERKRDAEHPYAHDLDLFDAGSSRKLARKEGGAGSSIGCCTRRARA
jgi:hypothetical protein